MAMLSPQIDRELARKKSELTVAYITATLRGLACQPLQVGGVADHIHILAGLSRTISLADLVKNLKTSSTKVVKDEGHLYFGWQTGYGAFAVSQSLKDSVISYIASQEIHHRKMTLQEEFRMLLQERVLERFV